MLTQPAPRGKKENDNHNPLFSRPVFSDAKEGARVLAHSADPTTGAKSERARISKHTPRQSRLHVRRSRLAMATPRAALASSSSRCHELFLQSSTDEKLGARKKKPVLVF